MARTRSSILAFSSSRSIREVFASASMARAFLSSAALYRIHIRFSFSANFARASFSLISPAATCLRRSAPMARRRSSISALSSSRSICGVFASPFMANAFFSSAARYRIHIRFSPSANLARASSSLISPAATFLRRSMPMARTRSSIFAFSSSRSTCFVSAATRSCALAVVPVVAVANVRPATASRVQAETARQPAFRGCG